VSPADETKTDWTRIGKQSSVQVSDGFCTFLVVWVVSRSDGVREYSSMDMSPLEFRHLEASHLQSRKGVKWQRLFWFSFLAVWLLTTFLLWDYGFNILVDGLSFGSIALVAAEVFSRGNDASSDGLISLFMAWINHTVFRTERKIKWATVALVSSFFCLALYYSILPPLKFGIAVRGLEAKKVGPIKVSVEGEPNAVEINSAGYGFVRVPGFNFGHLTFVGAYSERHPINLTTSRVPTQFLWKHRFDFLGGPFPLEITVEPSPEEKAEQLLQESLQYMDKGDCRMAIQKLDQALALKDLSEAEKQLLSSARKPCLLRTNPMGKLQGS
jgi:hypothetical protein